jgi:hypothetical protein
MTTPTTPAGLRSLIDAEHCDCCANTLRIAEAQAAQRAAAAPDARLREALDIARKETRARHAADSDWSHGAMWAINRLERVLDAAPVRAALTPVTPPASADVVVEAARAAVDDYFGTYDGQSIFRNMTALADALRAAEAR